MTRLERLAHALSVVTTRAAVAVAVTPCELRNPLNGRGVTVSRGARMAENARRKRERAVGRILAMRLEGCVGAADKLALVLRRESPRPFDDDNLAAAFKSIRDGIAERWGLDDGSDDIVWLYDWVKSPRHLVVASLWPLPLAGRVAPSDVEVDASDWERPRTLRGELRATPNVIRSRGGA